MMSMNYIEEIKGKHLLGNEDMIEILERLSYIARDNGYDDSIFDDLMDELSK